MCLGLICLPGSTLHTRQEDPATSVQERAPEPDGGTAATRGPGPAEPAARGAPGPGPARPGVSDLYTAREIDMFIHSFIVTSVLVVCVCVCVS